MKKRIPLFLSVLITIFAVIISLQCCYLYVNRNYEQQIKELKASKQIQINSKLAEIDSIYRNNYIGEIDDETMEKALIYGYLLGTGDRYTQYMTAEEYDEFFTDLNGDMVGIGVIAAYADDGTIEICAVIPDSPAEKSGILRGDRIAAVEGESTAELGYNAAIDRVKGQEGTEVHLSVLRGDELIPFTIVRAPVKTLSVLYHLFENENDHIGIVKILEFDATTPVQFKDAVNSLIDMGAKSFVFDVRDNLGGELTSVVDVLDMLLPEGPVIRIKDALGNESQLTSGPSELKAPMTVLVNEYTASAAELFSSALRDYKKAELVGVHTYGKGCMQNIQQLSDGSALRITVKMYNSPYSDNYDGIGLEPDVVVELSESAAAKNPYTIKDTDDNQLLAAVKELKAIREQTAADKSAGE